MVCPFSHSFQEDFMKYWSIILSILFLWTSLSLSGERNFVKPLQKDKCPVCGMFVEKYPQWIAEVVFQDGTYVVFDGVKDMLKYFFDMGKYNPEKTKEDIDAIYVTEYYTTRIMKAEDVYFIVGSDVLGPMGNELIPVKGEDSAKTFMWDHRGKKMLRFNEIKPADIP